MRNRFLTLLLALIFIFTLTPHSFATEIANNTQITTATPTDLEPCFIIQSFTDSTGTYSVQKFNDRIYYVNAGHSALSDKAHIKLSGKISDEVKFNKIFTGKDDASWFDLSQDGAVEVLNDSFIIDLNKAYKAEINPAGDNNLIYSTGSGCYYIELSNNCIYTLVVDIKNKATSPEEFPKFIGLYNPEKNEFLDDGIYQISDFSTSATTYRYGTLMSDVPIYLQARVENGRYGLSSLSISDGKSWFLWSDLLTNWVIVNGERIGGADCVFGGANSNDSVDIFSPKFGLKHGLNVVEVCHNSVSPFILSLKKSKWVSLDGLGLSDKRPNRKMTSAVYIIDYDGPETENTDLSSDVEIETIKAALLGEAKTTPTEATIARTEDGFTLIAPMKFGDPINRNPRFRNNTVLLVIKTHDALASVEIPQQSKTVTIQNNEKTDNLVGGHAYLTFALDLLFLNDNTFDIIVTAQDGTKKTYPVKVIYSDSNTALSNVSLTGASLDVAYDDNVLTYYVDYDNSSSSNAIFGFDLPKDGSAKLDGSTVDSDNGTVSISFSPLKKYYVLTVIAADGFTTQDYYFVTRYTQGTDDPADDVLPVQTISDETKTQAKKLLNAYSASLDETEYIPSPWSVFMAAAVKGCDINNSAASFFEGKNVYDVSKDNNLQATIPARDILQLIILGQNPYNFDPDGDGVGINLIEKLEVWKTGGAWANNIWYYMAAKAAGVDPRFEESIYSGAASYKYDMDMRAWSIATMSGSLETKDMVRLVHRLHPAQNVDGEYIGLFFNPSFLLGGVANLYTNGTVLSAVASAGMDIEEEFALQVDGKSYSMLDTIEEKLFSDDGLFVDVTSSSSASNTWPKDLIIGLADTIYESNLWARYQLTEEKYANLISLAKENGIDTDSMPNFGNDGYGKAYYELYEQIANKLEAEGNTSMRPKVIWGMPYEKFMEAVDNLPQESDDDFIESVQKVIAFYEELDDNNLKAISSDSLALYHTAVFTALKKQDSTEKSADFYKRVLALRNPLNIGEDSRGEVEALRYIFDHMENYQIELIGWCGASVLQKLQAAEAVLYRPVSGGGSSPKTMTISFKLLGALDDGEDGAVNTLMDNNLEEWYSITETFNADSLSAEEVFRIIMGDAGIEWRGNSQNQYGTLYVSGIRNPNPNSEGYLQWMEELTTTPNSGWMYTVNGKHPGVGLSNYTLHDGDEFVVHYTDDFTKEEDAAKFNGGGSAADSKTDEKKDEEKDKDKPAETPAAEKVVETVKVEAKADAKGVAKAEVKTADVTKAVKSAAEKKADSIVIAPEVTGDAKEVKVELPKASVSEIAKSTDAALVVETDKGSVEVPNEVLKEIAEQADGANVEISVAVKSVEDAAVKEAISDKLGDDVKTDNAAVAEITVTSGDKKITTFSGKMINASVSVDGKKGFAEGKKYLTLVISENGKRELLAGKCSKGADGKLNVGVKVGHLSTFVVLDKELKSFADAEAHWSADAVDFAVANGLMNGTSDTAFAPNMTLNRAMLVTILYRLAGSPVAMATDKFTDVAAGQWYSDAVAWAAANGIVTGKTETTFAPMDNITREQFATMLMRYCKFAGVDTAKNADLGAFTDASSISSYAKDALAWANASGIITGRTATTIAPTGSATRGEAATMLMRFMQM